MCEPFLCISCLGGSMECQGHVDPCIPTGRSQSVGDTASVGDQRSPVDDPESVH